MSAANDRITPLLPAVVMAMLCLRLLTLGAYPLSDATEARYAEIARKMVVLNDWVTPWYDNGVPFWAKPPLSTWITALSMKVFGINEFGARFPHFLAALLVIWLLADWLRRRDRRQAMLVAALLSGSVLFFVAAGAVMTDMTLTVGIVMAMRGFWLALHGVEHERRREHWLFFCGLALGLMAKGPVALVLCVLPIALWAIVTGNLRATWKGFSWLGGMLLVALLVVPWYIVAEQRTPGFLHYFLVGEHWQRFTEAAWPGDRYGTAHAVPTGTIWIYALAASLPWPLLLPILALARRPLPAAAPAPDQRLCSRYLWAWALTPCLFFTASRNIIWTYVLPGMPALAVLGAGWLGRDRDTARTDRWVAAGLLMSLVAFAGTLVVMQRQQRFRSAKLVVSAVEQHGAASALVFVGHGIYSPAFYSRGQATQLGDIAQLGATLDAAPPSAPRFVALYGSQWKALPCTLQQRLRPVGRYGNYALYAVGSGGMRAHQGDAVPLK
ncbi:MAG TPA: glycosyltransferase family 39 protein [Telluria sp.]|nr:glycosyltransferase family 39 protein [Telluria sp.]